MERVGYSEFDLIRALGVGELMVFLASLLLGWIGYYIMGGWMGGWV